MALVIGGVDTHSDTHCAAVIDQVGRLCGTSEFPTTEKGLAELRRWMSGFGELTASRRRGHRNLRGRPCSLPAIK